MPGWTEQHGWMRFDYLDAAPYLDACFTITYRYTDDGSEQWSARANSFKSKNPAAWWGTTYLIRSAIKPLFISLGLSADNVVFIPALGSKETKANPDGHLAVIAKQSSDTIKCKYSDELVVKQVHGQLHLIYDAAGRDAELARANYSANKTDASVVFVFDDFVTRGSTLSATARALKTANPTITAVYGIALAKADRKAYASNETNSHVTAEWDALWRKGEEDYKDRLARK